MIPLLDRSAALHSRATALQARAEPHRASPPNTLTFWLPPLPPVLDTTRQQRRHQPSEGQQARGGERIQRHRLLSARAPRERDEKEPNLIFPCRRLHVQDASATCLGVPALYAMVTESHRREEGGVYPHSD